MAVSQSAVRIHCCRPDFVTRLCRVPQSPIGAGPYRLKVCSDSRPTYEEPAGAVEPGRTPPGARADASRSPWAWVVVRVRALVTGSKFWSDWRMIKTAISLVWEPDTLLTGACREEPRTSRPGAGASGADPWSAGRSTGTSPISS